MLTRTINAHLLLFTTSVSEDEFTIVLIDTPGMDSAQSSEDGMNRHAEIALNAISMESKPMIILCVDGQKYEDTGRCPRRRWPGVCKVMYPKRPTLCGRR